MGSQKRPRNIPPTGHLVEDAGGIICPAEYVDIRVRLTGPASVGVSGYIAGGDGVLVLLVGGATVALIEDARIDEISHCMDLGFRYEGVISRISGEAAWMKMTAS